MAAKLNGSAKWVLAIIAVISLFLLGIDRFIGIGELQAEVVQNTKDNAMQEESIGELKVDVAVIKSTTAQTAKDITELRKDVKTLLRRYP